MHKSLHRFYVYILYFYISDWLVEFEVFGISLYHDDKGVVILARDYNTHWVNCVVEFEVFKAFSVDLVNN